MNHKLLFVLLFALTAIGANAQDNSIVLVSSYQHGDGTFVVLDIIDYSKMKNVTNLEVNSNTITEIPPGIFKLSSLEELKINTTGITAVPADIKKLKNLKVLNLSNTSVSELPEEIEQLVHLQELHLPFIYWAYRSDKLKQFTKVNIILE